MPKQHKYIIKIGLIIVFLLLCLWHTHAQNNKQEETRYGYFMKGKRQSFTKIPFEFLSNLIIVKLQIDNSDTLRFVLDTGVNAIIVSSPSIAAKLMNKNVRRIKINGVGEGSSSMASVSVGHRLKMGDIIANYQNIVCLNEDDLQLSTYLGVPIHGIFGHEIFNNFVVTIDFTERTLHLSLPEKFKYRKAAFGEKYQISLYHSKPRTSAVSIEDSDKFQPLNLLIDTGASHAMLLNTLAIRLPKKTIRANLGRGLNGEVHGNIGRMKNIKIANVLIGNILAVFPDVGTYGNNSHMATDTSEQQGSIGCELLRRFVCTFNYQEGYLALLPLKNKIKEPFEYDMSGLEVRAKGQAYKSYFIENVVENSPADNSGLQIGDELMFFNNKNIIDLNLTEIYNELSKKEGRVINLIVRRNNQILAKNFRLKRMI